MMAGSFRCVCANGLVLGDCSMDQKVRHSGRGDVVGDVIEGAYEVLNQLTKIDDKRDCMKQIQLRPAEQEAFAMDALASRYDTSEGPAPVTTSQLMRARRSEDRSRDLCTTVHRRSTKRRVGQE